MDNRIKAIFFDVDGTLLSHTTGDVPESARKALAELRRRGVKTIVATGRHMIEYAQLPLSDILFDGYLMLNGQLLLDEERKIYAGTPIDSGEMEVLARMFEAKRIPIALVGEKNYYINYIDETVIRTQESTHGKALPIGCYNGEKIYQIVAFIQPHQKKILDGLLDECHVTSWHDTGADIIPVGGGKSVGIQQYLDRYGIDRSETMAFGDGENDIEMLRFVGIGVAMGNAGEAVKAAADYVTDTIDNDGVEKALRHFGII